MVRKMSLSDVGQAVRIHLESFPNFFLSFLGPGFLRTYYRSACLDGEGICLVSVNDTGQLSGFAVGSSAPGGFYRRIFRKHLWAFVINTIRAISARPKIIARLIRTAGRAAGSRDNATAGLFSIAVSPNAQGRGAGRELMDAFIREAKARGCCRVTLTTDREDNDRVNRFYHSLGFAVKREFVTPEGRRMFQYLLHIGQHDPRG